MLYKVYILFINGFVVMAGDSANNRERQLRGRERRAIKATFAKKNVATQTNAKEGQLRQHLRRRMWQHRQMREEGN